MTPEKCLTQTPVYKLKVLAVKEGISQVLMNGIIASTSMHVAWQL